MAIRVQSFRSAVNLRDFMENNDLGPEDITYLGQSASGFLEILFDDSAEVIEYHAGASGTVTPAEGDRIHRVWCVGAAGATVEIFGGDAVPVPSGSYFEVELKGYLLGDAVKTIVFTNTTSYFVSYIPRAV